MKPTIQWPPLVGVANQPLWLRLRDVLLTTLAWGLLGWMLAAPLALAIDFLFIGPVFELTRHEPVDWRSKWLLLRPFAMAAAILVVWVLVWALLRTRPLAANSAQPPPAPLPLADHAARWGLEAQAVEAWRSPQIGVAMFDSQNRLVEIETSGDRHHK